MSVTPITDLLSITVTNARRIGSRVLFALVDVEVRAAGVAFDILGVQARHLPGGGTTVCQPMFKEESGAGCPAIRLPEEVRLAFLMEEGLAQQKFDPATGLGVWLDLVNRPPNGALRSKTPTWLVA